MATAPLVSLILNRNSDADLIYDSTTNSYRSVPKDISILSIGGNDYTIRDDEARGSLANKQDTLVSGTNIKTINNNSLLGSGNITIDSLPSQSGNSGKYLTTNGSSASWANINSVEPFTINEIDAIWNNTSGVLYYAWDLTGSYNLAGEPTKPISGLSSGYYYTDKEIPDENTTIYTTSSSNTIPFISYNNSSGVMNCGNTSNVYNTLYRCSRNASGDVNNLSEANFYNSNGGVTGK